MDDLRQRDYSGGSLGDKGMDVLITLFSSSTEFM